jgi:signal transduction histidine kinase
MEKHTTRILLVEDDAGDRTAMAELLQKGDLPCELVVATSAGEGIARLLDGGLDLAILDHQLPDGTALDLQRAAGDTACICLTDPENISIAVEAIKEGAQDYLIKDEKGEYLDLLPTVVSNALERSHIKEENRRYRENLDDLVEERVEKIRDSLVEQLTDTFVEQARPFAEDRAEEIRHRQKCEVLAAITPAVIHEINNPLNGIINYGDLILMDTESTSPIFRWASGIVEESTKIARIVQNLLSFARPGDDEPVLISPDEIVKTVIALLRHAFLKSQVSISADLPPRLPDINCRKQMMQQMLVNLLNNAHDALNERYAGYDENKLIVVRGRSFERNKTQWIRLTVEDVGAGIPRDAIEHIFDPYFTTKEGSSAAGLGLSVSLDIIKEHSGEISIETEQNRGTRVHVDLPAAL